MRRIGFAAVMGFAVGLATFGKPAPAAAHDYPWCVQGRDVGYPGECAYQSYGQCLASASGRNAYCGINPRVAFRRERQPAPGYYPYRYRE